jgi:hypothetical protein
MLSAIAVIALLGVPLASAENSSQTGQTSSQHVAMNHQLLGWAEKLKGQTIVEDAMGGKPDRSAKVEQQHQRIMEHMAQDPQVQGVNTGMYNTSAMMHQYGAGGQDMPDGKLVEHLSLLAPKGNRSAFKVMDNPRFGQDTLGYSVDIQPVEEHQH